MDMHWKKYYRMKWLDRQVEIHYFQDNIEEESRAKGCWHPEDNKIQEGKAWVLTYQDQGKEILRHIFGDLGNSMGKHSQWGKFVLK